MRHSGNLLLQIGSLLLLAFVPLGVLAQTPSMLDPTVTQVAGGQSHTCALTTAGAVQCWGRNFAGQLGNNSTTQSNLPVPVSGLDSGVVAIAAGAAHTCALTTAGAVQCWGQNNNGQLGNNSTTNSAVPVPVSGLSSGVAAIAAGQGHTCALTTAGALQCWGFNGIGQLGNGTTTDSHVPVPVSGLGSGVTAITTGAAHTCALSTAGAVQCWGYNNTGQLGDNSTTTSPVPVPVSGLSSGVVAIAAGQGHTCALTTTGVPQCWGWNFAGQLGDGTTTDSTVPVPVSDLGSGATAITAGAGHTCALTTAGALQCWGYNGDGELGNGTTTDSSVPAPVSNLGSGVAAITAGSYHTCALTTTGALQCWGSNSFGALGTGATTDSSVPVPVSGLSGGVAAISSGAGDHTCALTTAGAVQCWGFNAYGELGNGTTTDSPVPVPVSGLGSGVAVVVAGQYDACALTTAGAMLCWGNNGEGELGNGTTTSSSVPVPVNGLGNDVVAIAAGALHTCALTAPGAVQCWGYNNLGQLGNGTTTDSSVPVPVSGLGSDVVAITAGEYHTCALTTAGAMYCWGWNNYGQLGNGTTTDSSVPVPVSGLDDAVAAITAGTWHTCALTTAGAMYCWGFNAFGELGNNAATLGVPVLVSGLGSGVAAIAAGAHHTCALTAAGAMQCWGWNTSGQIGNGTATESSVPAPVSGLDSGVAAITAGQFHTCALTTAGALQCWGGNHNGQLGNGHVSNVGETGSFVPVTVLAGQSLAFAPAATMTIGGTLSLSANATGPGSVPVTFDTWTPDACSISGNTVTAIATSTALCGVRASRAGGADGTNDTTGTTAAAPQQLRLIRVTLASPTLVVSSSLNPSTVGDSVIFTAALSAAITPTGAVSFCADATTTNAACTGGSVLCTIAANATPLACPSTSLSAGIHAISAYFAGDANNNATTSFLLSQVVDGLSQTLTFTSTAPTNALVGANYTVAATASSGLTVTFSIDAASTASACSMVDNVVTFTSAGSCIIDADQAGNTIYAAAPRVQQTVAIDLNSQTITFTSTVPTTALVGGSYTVAATASSGLAVTFSIDPASTASACSLSGNVVSFSGAGSCLIDADQAGNTTYAAAPRVQQTVAIGLNSQTITFTSTAPTTALVGGSYTVAATASSGLAVTFSIDPASTASACSLSGNVVTFTGAGSCFINADQAGNTTYAAAPRVQQAVAIGLHSQTLSFTSIAPTTALVGGSYTVAATASSGLPVTFGIDAASTAGTCTIASNMVTFTGAGSCIINADQAGNTTYAAAPRVQQTVAIGLNSQTLSFTSTAPTNALVGGNYTVTATASSGLTVAFNIDATSTASACSLSGNVVTFTGAGSCIIDADQAGNTTYTAAPRVQQAVAIGLNSQTLSFTSIAPTTALVGGIYTVAATASSGLTATFSIDVASSVGACSLSGSVVTFTGAGSCIINADQAGNTTYAAAPRVQQAVAIGLNSQTISFTSSAPTTALVGGSYTVAATASSGLAVAFSIDATSTASACSLSGNVVTFTGAGSCFINADQAGNTTYAAASRVQQTVAIGLNSQTISFTSSAPTNALVGGNYAVTATASSGLPVTFSIDAASSVGACSLSGNVVSFTGAGSCLIDANQAGNTTYATAPQAQQAITLGDAIFNDGFEGP